MGSGSRKSDKVDVTKLWNREAIRELLDSGVDIDTQDDNGCTPLHDAAYKGLEDTVFLLLEFSPDVNKKNGYGSTPLHFAAFTGQCIAASALIRAGASLEAKNEDGWTPLHYAAWMGNRDMVDFLLEHGADATLHDVNGNTPQDLARNHKHPELAEYLDAERIERQRRERAHLKRSVKDIRHRLGRRPHLKK